ncbi:hypothetical protein OE88DRAFT_852566 [Heliocybe sulcata]|uniref:Uncharacterized protein n=1 Tax=Heliocybe sulcata TaxID=5364 RepID=A0A5C3MP32_9AGAM|nr:hypothetical protein OE88DRAFT_852566 [Heliocybe sulcata]
MSLQMLAMDRKENATVALCKVPRKELQQGPQHHPSITSPYHLFKGRSLDSTPALSLAALTSLAGLSSINRTASGPTASRLLLVLPVSASTTNLLRPSVSGGHCPYASRYTSRSRKVCATLGQSPGRSFAKSMQTPCSATEVRHAGEERASKKSVVIHASLNEFSGRWRRWDCNTGSVPDSAL